MKSKIRRKRPTLRKLKFKLNHDPNLKYLNDSEKHFVLKEFKRFGESILNYLLEHVELYESELVIDAMTVKQLKNEL